MRDGIRYSLMWPISPGGPTVPITLKRCGFKSTPIAEYEGFIFRTGCTPRTNYPPSLSCFCPSRTRREQQWPLQVNVGVEIENKSAVKGVLFVRCFRRDWLLSYSMWLLNQLFKTFTKCALEQMLAMIWMFLFANECSWTYLIKLIDNRRTVKYIFDRLLWQGISFVNPPVSFHRKGFTQNNRHFGLFLDNLNASFAKIPAFFDSKLLLNVRKLCWKRDLQRAASIHCSLFCIFLSTHFKFPAYGLIGNTGNESCTCYADDYSEQTALGLFQRYQEGTPYIN